MFASFSTKVLHRYRQRVNSETAREMRQHHWAIRHGLNAVFLYCRQREIIDGLIELFIQIVHRLSARSERRLVKTLLADFQRVHGKTALLFRIAEAALNNPDGLVRDVVYPVAGEDTLKSLLSKNRKVKILSQGKNRISITPFEPQEELVNLAGLKREIASRWPMASLLNVLKETDLRIGFSDHLKASQTVRTSTDKAFSSVYCSAFTEWAPILV